MDVTHTDPGNSAALRVTRGGSRGVAVAAVLISGLVSMVFAPFALWLVREQLHIGCATYPAGSEGAGSWSCSDGIGYIYFAVGLGSMWLLTVLLGSLVAGLSRNAQASRIGLWFLALGATGCVLGWYWSSTRKYVIDENSPVNAEGFWWSAVGPAAAVAVTSVVCAGVALFIRGRAAIWVAIAAAVMMTVAVGVQPGLGFNLLPVAGLLAGLAARTPAHPVSDLT